MMLLTCSDRRKTKMIISNLFGTGRSDGVSLAGISVGVWGRDYYNPTQSKSSNASSVRTPSIPGKVVAAGSEYVRLARPHVGGRTLEASVQAPLTVKRDHRKYSFLFLSTD
jgi:hypothetical protein